MLFGTNEPEENTNHIIVFDVRDGQYHLFSCLPIWKPNETNPDTTFYSDYFLKAVYEIYDTPIAEEMASVFSKLFMNKN
jgi:leucyl-tRNA---protein transferase